MRSQVNPIATLILALVKWNRQMGFQVDRAIHKILVLVNGDRYMRS
jgi:hypothetical protein